MVADRSTIATNSILTFAAEVRDARERASRRAQLPGRLIDELVSSENAPDPRRMVAVKNHPGIFRRGRKYVVVFYERGRQRKKSCATLTEARKVKAQASAGQRVPASATTFSAYAAEWIRTYSGRTRKGVAEATLESYADILFRVAIPYFGTTRLERIDPPMLREYIAHLSARKTGTNRTASPATVSRYYAPVRALLATAYEDGLILHQPKIRVVIPGAREAPRRWLTPSEIGALLHAMPTSSRDLALLLASTGLRIGEALALTWGSIGFAADGSATLTVQRAKTEAGVRTLPLSPAIGAMLFNRRAQASDPRPAAPVFPSSTGTFLDPRNYRRRVFGPAAKAAGVAWATPHDLRHGLATLLAQRGFGPAEIARHLGHADGGQLALRTYIHPEVRRADFVDEVFRLNAPQPEQSVEKQGGNDLGNGRSESS